MANNIIDKIVQNKETTLSVNLSQKADKKAAALMNNFFSVNENMPVANKLATAQILYKLNQKTENTTCNTTIKLFTNTSHSKVFIENAAGIVKLFNAKGKIVLIKKVEPGLTTILETGKLKKGLYYIEASRILFEFHK